MSKIDDDFPQEPERPEEISPDDLDLELENKALHDDLTLRGMTDIYLSDDLDPALENAFLNEVIEYEDACQEMTFPTIAQLLPAGYPLPPAADLDDAAVQAKMAEICDILAHHGVDIGFNDSVPDRVAYEYLRTECLDEEVMGPVGMPGYTYVLDGCSGSCEDCFQLAWCATGQKQQNDSNQE